MIDQLILSKADCISFREEDISVVEVSSEYIRKNFENQKDFGNYFIGGSYTRDTGVKSLSYINLYFEYKFTLLK